MNDSERHTHDPVNPISILDSQKFCTEVSRNSRETLNETLNQESSRILNLHSNSRNISRTARRNKIKVASYRQRLKLYSKFEVKLESKILSQDAINFCLSQLKRRNVKPKGRRFTTEDKLFALMFYKQSGRCYRKMRQIFALPSRQTIMSMLNKIPVDVGINKIIFDNLKESASKLNNQDRICALIFDEMSIMPHIDYDKYTDTFFGFQNFGFEQNLQIADHVLVFFIRGVFKKWQQPIYFAFSFSSTKSYILTTIIKTLVEKIQNCGFKILVTICDQGQPNQAAINSLLKESKQRYIHKGMEPKRRILLGDQEIIPLYDTPHLIKCIRNNLLTKNLVWKTSEEILVANWKHIIDAYYSDQTCGELRALHKITDLHVIPEKIQKMKVCYATQVLSHSMASTITLLVKSSKYKFKNN